MRVRSALTVALVLVAAAGCSGGGGAGSPLLLVGTNAGLAVLDAATGVLDGPTGVTVTTPGGELLVHAQWRGTRTVLRAERVADGSDAWDLELDGSYEPRTASVGASRVALGPPSEPLPPGILVAPRSTTELVVAHEDGRVDRYDLDGNVEPEAFSLDGTGLFVLSFQPPEAPTSYQVRRLNLRSGAIEDVYSVDAELQETMRGTARTQAWDPDGSRLYTLYTDDRGTNFVHVLDLDEQWAHCVDLPSTIVPDTAGMAVADGGETLYVADATGGVLAEVDTVDLAVARSVDVAAEGSGWLTSVAVGDDAVFVADGAHVVRLDRGSLEPQGSFSVPGVVGVQWSHVSDELFVADTGAVSVLDPRSGDVVRRWHVDAARTGGVVSLGGRTVPGYAGVQCAC
jgi:hypothetical protein